MTRAIILAGGSGSRIGGEMPKQFLEVCGKPIVAHTIGIFENHPLVDDIIIVCKADYIHLLEKIVETQGFNKVSTVIAGGKERYLSSMIGLSSCKNPDDIVLIHDCARPMISKRIITECIESMEGYDAVTVAIPSSDTIYMSDDKGNITDIPQRSYLRRAQTPQCFRVSLIKEAYSIASSHATDESAFIPTDDCSVVFKYLPSCKIHIVEGESTNIKITYKEDVEMFEQYLLQLSSQK